MTMSRAVFGLGGLAIAVAAAVVAVSLTVPRPASPGPTASTATGGASDGSFAVRMTIEHTTYRIGEPINATAGVTYVGPMAQVVPYGSGGGMVVFSLEQLDGPLDMGPASDAMCATQPPLSRGSAVFVPFAKSGGFSETDPQAAFWRSFFAEKELRLPRGTWRLHAQLDAWLGGCGAGGEEHTLDAAATIEVVDN